VQAVLADVTIIILHAGNAELICIRHRRTQTLYVTGVIEPPNCRNPGYGKLHVGIYIAAIRDATDRLNQLLNETPSHPPDDDNGPGGHNDEEKGKDNEGKGKSRDGSSQNRDKRSRREGGGQGESSSGKTGEPMTRGSNKFADACEIAAREVCRLCLVESATNMILNGRERYSKRATEM
jgi:hypothetical protein